MSARLAFPKPRGALRRFWDLQYGHIKGEPRPSIEHKLLAHFAEHADLLDVQVPKSARQTAPDGWLLVPVDQWAIDALAAVFADLENDETSGDLEDAGDFETQTRSEEGAYGGEDDREPEEDDEHSIVRPRSMSRRGLAAAGDDIATAEQRARYRAGRGDELARRDGFRRRLRFLGKIGR